MQEWPKPHALSPRISGRSAPVFLCHGTKAYKVEFDGIKDFFAMGPDVLEKI